MSAPQSASAAPRRWAFVDALGDGLYGIDRAGHCLFVNAAALRLLGYDSAEELIGRNMHAAIHHTRPDGSAYPHEACPLILCAQTGEAVRLNNEMLWRRDGTSFLAEYAAFPVYDDEGAISGSVVTFKDVSALQDSKMRLAVQYTVAQVLAGSGTLEGMAQRLLDAIGVGLGWDAGLLWVMREGADAMCTATWRSPASESGAEFGCDTLTAPDPTGDVMVEIISRASAARFTPIASHGFRGRIAFPILNGAVVIGVLEFFNREPIRADEGLKVALFSLGQQIGRSVERQLTTARLRESERLKGAILALSPDCVITLDGDGLVTEFNATAERTFDRPVADVIGQVRLLDLFAADTHPVVEPVLERGLAGDPAVLGRRMELVALGAGGRPLPVEFTLSQTAIGPRPLFTAYLRDISQRRREEDRLRESENRFRIIANGIPQLAWMTDPSGAIVWYNQRWYDYTVTTFAEMAGWGWRTVQHPDHVERVVTGITAAFAAGDAWEDTFPLRSGDGTYTWFLSRAVPVRAAGEDGAEGPILGWFGTNTDISALRESEQALEQARDEAEAANRAKSTFLANMSHELRTPLSAIIGYAEMLLEELDDGSGPEIIRPDLAKIESNARHLLGLINNVLDLSKVESGKMEAFLETFDIAEMGRDVAATISALLQKRSNRLELDLADNLGTMHSDITRIRQILLNLLGNASKFTENGTIRLGIRRVSSAHGDEIELAVADTGIGMSEEQIGRLFQRFQQADASTTRQFGGTGLGLALTRAFAHLLGGRIDVTSTPGQGTTFTVCLPAVLQTPVADEVPDTAEAGANEPRGIVLVIDDDETQRDLMSRFLQREGYGVRTAADGRAGLELAHRLKPLAILLDVTMPGMDGWSVLSALKADAELADIPVVMVTFTHERALAASLGAADYVVKPVDWERLRHVMDRFRDDDGDVLIVEDEGDMRQRLRQILEKQGWPVREAGDGAEALAAIRAGRPRLILLDLNMPVMDGFSFLATLRQEPGGESIPVVVLTALDLTAEDRKRLRGANQVLSKGHTSLAELADRLRRLGPEPASHAP